MVAHFQTIIKISVMCLSRRQQGFKSPWGRHNELLRGISAQAGVPFAISMSCPESLDDNKR
jgi:hypothetical protein